MSHPTKLTPKTLVLSMIMLSIILSGVVHQPVSYAASPTALAPDALSAKALLEDLLARRFTQNLATRLDRNIFSVSAELDLRAIPRQPSVTRNKEILGEQEPISDLSLGMLDPEALLKNYAAPGQQQEIAKQFLEGFKIRTVAVNVGLSETVTPETRAEIEKWITERVNSEFGKAGKGTVTTIRIAPQRLPSTASPKTPWDVLNQFQSLAGQLVLAMAIVSGVLLWGLMSARKQSNQVAGSADNNSNSRNPSVAGSVATASTGLSEEEKQRLEVERDSRQEEIASVGVEATRLKILDVLPKVNQHLEAILRAWSQSGETGWKKIATISEVVGKELGKLPIPVDAVPDVQRTFAKMAGVKMQEKFDILQKSYWDLLTVLNIGPSALDQPFGYLGGMNIGMVSQVLMEQNPKMRTIVSLFMPTELRSKFMKTMSIEAKRELLISAAGMSEIATDELKSFDRGLMSKFKSDEKSDIIPLEMTLNKLVEALDPTEQVVLLAGMQGQAADEFRRSTPSLAFLAEWPDEALAALLAQASADEIVALCRVRPDLKDRVLKCAPQLTVAMVDDELSAPDRLSAKDKAMWIEALSKRLRTLVMTKALVLDEIFPLTANSIGQNQESKIEEQDAGKKAA
jgi:flagellar motor switch protein FliG